MLENMVEIKALKNAGAKYTSALMVKFLALIEDSSLHENDLSDLLLG